MSDVMIKDREIFEATHTPSGAKGELICFTRVVRRRKAAKQTITTTYEAIFNIEEPLLSDAGKFFDIGSYFLKEFGTCNVTALEERCTSAIDRNQWVSMNFSTR